MTDLRGLLQDAGRRRQEAERDRDEAMDTIAALVREGHAAGMGVSELAELAGVSRQTIYTLLAEDT